MTSKGSVHQHYSQLNGVVPACKTVLREQGRFSLWLWIISFYLTSLAALIMVMSIRTAFSIM